MGGYGLGFPFTGGGRCRSGLTEPSDLTAVSWTGWWNGNNYFHSSGGAGIASAGSSGSRTIGRGTLDNIVGLSPYVAVPTSRSNNPAHGRPVIGGGGKRQCAIIAEFDDALPSAKWLEASVPFDSLISRGAFTSYVVARWRRTSFPIFELDALNHDAFMRLGTSGMGGGAFPAGVPVLTAQVFCATTGVIPSAELQFYSTGAGISQGAVLNKMLVFEVTFDITQGTIRNRLRSRLNGTSYNPSFAGTGALGTGGEDNGGVSNNFTNVYYTDSSPTESGIGIIPWANGSAARTLPASLFGRVRKVDASFNPTLTNNSVDTTDGSTPTTKYDVDLYAFLVTNTALSGAARDLCMAALMTEYGAT